MKKIVIFALLAAGLTACVSPRKYIRVSELYTACRADSAKYRNEAEQYREERNRYQAESLRLMQDTMRLYNAYNQTEQKYNQLLNKGYEEAARVTRQLDENKKRYSLTLPAKSRTETIAQGMDEAIGVVKRSLQTSLGAYAGRGIGIRQEEWSLIIRLNDSLIFERGCQTLSATGKGIVNSITDVVMEKNNFDVIVKERTPNAFLYRNPEIIVREEMPVVVAEKVIEKVVREEPVKDTLPDLNRLDTARLLSPVQKRVETAPIPPKQKVVVAVDTLSGTVAPATQEKEIRVPVPFRKSTVLMRAFRERSRGRAMLGLRVEREVDPKVDDRNLDGTVEIVLKPKIEEIYKLINEK